MEIFSALAALLANPLLLLTVFAAALCGMVIGAIPGLTASAAIAMLLPLTLFFDPLVALSFLYVIGKSGRYGGSIAAILFNTPGTAASAATQQDGYPLAMQGKAGKALKVATVSSVIGDFIGDMLLIFGVGAIAKVAVNLGPIEYFSIYFAAFVVISSVIGPSIVRGLVSAAFGIMVALVGNDPITGIDRLTFGNFDLANGIHLVPLMIGVFVLGEVITQLENLTDEVTEIHVSGSSPGDNSLTWQEYKPCIPVVIRSSFIGAFIGILPGMGSAVAAFVGYSEGYKHAKNKEQWGKGALEGIAAPEAANNAVSGPSMAPLLTLGIPGSTIGAILIGVFIIHGIQIGPTLFMTSSELVYGLFAAGLLGILFYGLLGYFGAARLGHLICKIPVHLLYPLILITAFIAAYSARNSMFDVLVMVVAGICGWLMRKLRFNVAAFIIAFVLTPGAEESLRQALLMSSNGWLVFLQNPVSACFIAIGLITFIRQVWTITKMKPKKGV